ncbi:cell division protein ZipA [Methylobacterium tarhaniae]|uniref:Cell division protein ZipA n=1 Tax=Methylobacterium tarhaniae TaxID=1187852 RepID=A0A0J6TAR6_9HYPH|nr:ATP-binding protein [Methylobacterium tarhaniae]KMO44390.1 cell division protein ZipA [Methylobacterium tarhaniae]
MPVTDAVLHLLCGKISSGKSTLAASLAARPGTILVREDAWLAGLYPGEQTTLAEYARNAKRLRGVMGPHLVALLRAGLSVVLDFPANTPESRAWMRTVFREAEAAHQLHYLEADDALCKARLHRRNAAGTHEFTVSDEAFDLFTRYFVPPAPEEGFTVLHHRQAGTGREEA